MKTTTTKTTLLTLSLLLATLTALPLPPSAETSWMPSYVGMGISFVNPPAGGEPFSRVEGTVSDPEFLLSLGFEGSIKGQRAVVTPFYTAGFTIAEGGGKYRPTIIKVQIGSQYGIISPGRGGALELLARGDANAKPDSGTSWAPSYLGMGIDFTETPAAGAAFTKVGGTISDPTPLKELGFEASEEGLEIALLREAPLYLNGEAKALVRIVSDGFYEVYVVEEGGRLVGIKEYLSFEQ